MRILYYCFLIFFAMSCSDDDTSVALNLESEWAMVSVCGGVTGECNYFDQIETIIVFTDHKLITYSNDEIVEESDYSINNVQENGDNIVFELCIEEEDSCYISSKKTTSLLEINKGSLLYTYQKID